MHPFPPEQSCRPGERALTSALETSHLTLQRLIINSTEDGGRYSFPTPQADDRAVHVATFTAAVYSIGSFIRDVLLIWPRNLAGDPDSP